MAKSALIAGITGQDGSYLAELLLRKGYEVHGLVRRLGTANTDKLASIRDRIQLVEGDLLDQTSLDRALEASEPDEVYNLAAPSFIGSSFKQPLLTGEIAGLGALRLIEVVKNRAPEARLYQACSSEMFGGTAVSPQNEQTPFQPRSPYGVAKVYAFWTGVNYRDTYGMFISNGITYNHESPRRGPEFVTRKISLGVARIAHGLEKRIDLGNLDARRDWGYAPEYVEAMWLMLQQDAGDDFVIATGETHTVREFLEEACRVAGIKDADSIVSVDKRHMRPADFVLLRGDPTKAKQKLGWAARTKFKDLVRIMVEADLELVAGNARG
jgi:GDPmannose 4,6-dehydratase